MIGFIMGVVTTIFAWVIISDIAEFSAIHVWCKPVGGVTVTVNRQYECWNEKEKKIIVQDKSREITSQQPFVKQEK